MNRIEKVRAEIREYFDPKNLIEDSSQTTFSPSKTFRLHTSAYRQSKPEVNWLVSKVEIFENGTDEKIFDLLANDRFFHAWFQVGDSEFLVCAEDMYGGQTVIDLTNRTMSSYSPDTDGFIWTEFFLSPDANTLAVIGCVWACPYEIRLYDFSDPMNLPLDEIKSVLLTGSETISHWLDNLSFQTKSSNIDVSGDSINRIISVERI